MNNKQKAVILGTGFLCGVIMVGVCFFIFSFGKGTPRASTSSSQNKASQTQQLETLKSQLNEAEQALEKAKTGKAESVLNDLQDNAQKLFGLYYNYDQSKITNEKRVSEATQWVTSDVAKQLFPLSADQQGSDFGVIQSQLNKANVYSQLQTGTTIVALVDCDYAVSSGSVHQEVPHYVFQVTYDTNSNKFTQVTELGKVGA